MQDDYIKIQQGDVLLHKVSAEKFNKANLQHKISKHKERAVLAAGEGSGHYHAVYMDNLLKDAEVTLCKSHEYTNRNEGLIITGNPVEIRHEEHNTITLEPGYYLQFIVNEFDHISGIARRVAD